MLLLLETKITLVFYLFGSEFLNSELFFLFSSRGINQKKAVERNTVLTGISIVTDILLPNRTYRLAKRYITVSNQQQDLGR